MRLQDHIDFTTLQWVKLELDESLSMARDALETYVDNPGDVDVMRSCASHLHQVHGTLRMVELYGAATVAAEMEALCSTLLDDRVTYREEAYATLMRGLMQLPDYLERLSGGHRDVPVVLLPLLNDLRASREQPPLSESAMFHPNLDAFLPEQAPAAMSEAYAEAHRGELVDLRLRFQQQLLGWFRGQNAAEQLVGMRKTLLAVTARCYHVHGRRLWWITAGVLEGVEQGMLKSQVGEIRQLIGKVDRNIRELLEHGENALHDGDADEVACKLLYIVAQAKQDSPHMELLRSTYELDSLLPGAGELEHARGSMSGHNRALLDSVSRALKDDLLRVKEALDLFLRQSDGDPAQLGVQGEVLERVGDTLGMLALAVPRRVVSEQRRIIDEIASRMRSPDEETLLDVAGALLYVEASLDDHIESLGSQSDPDEQGITQGLPRSEALGVVATLMQEAIKNTVTVKEAIVSFVESGWEHERLVGTPMLMDEVAGAMRMMSTPRPAELAQGVGRFIGYELLEDQRVPSGTQMDHLADAIAALEYYLEAAREHRGGLDHILDVAEHSLGLLGYWPVPVPRELPEPPAAATGIEAAADDGVSGQYPELTESVSVHPGHEASNLFVQQEARQGIDAQDLDGLRLAQTEAMAPSDPVDVHDGEDSAWSEIEEEIFEQVPVRDPLAANTRFNARAEGIDDDIREIFLEEMQEEIDSLKQAEADWLDDPSRHASLTGIRRSFHTLKGSGRLVGAGVLGEFAWKVEDLLNHVLDHSIEPDDNVQALIRHAIEALPGLLGALKGEGAPQAPLSAIMRAAEQLTAGRQARVEDYIASGTETVRKLVRRRIPRVEVDANAIPEAAVTERKAVDEPAVAEALDAAEDTPAFGMPSLPPVDPVLLEILRSEVGQYQQTIRRAIAQSGNELPIGEPLLRAVHTLHGAIAMVDIPLLTQLLSPLEGLVKRLRGAGLPLPQDGVRMLGESIDVVSQVMDQFDAAEPRLPDTSALTAQIIALRDCYPESKTPHIVSDPDADELASLDFVGGQGVDDDAPSDVVAGVAAEGEEFHGLADDHHDQLAAEMIAALGAFEPGEMVGDAASVDCATAEQAATEQAATEQTEEDPAAAEQVAAEQTEEDRAATELAPGRADLDATGAFAKKEQAQGSPNPVDADLLEVFIDEAREILDHADGVLAQWHADPMGAAYVPELQRDLHTLKGGARIAGLAPLGDLAHAIETLLEKPIGDEATAKSLIAALEASFDQLHALVQRVSQGEDIDYPQAAIDRLLKLAGTEILADEASWELDTKPASAPTPAPTKPIAKPIESATELPELLPEMEEEVHSSQEQIRVRADLLDSLVSHAGEVAIYRSRLEQQVAGYRFNLVELEQTVARLRSQLRMLEIETEAQIIARFQREHREAGLTAFDPLELDRYSQLQQYSRALAESVSDLVSIQNMLDELTRQAETLLIQQSRVSTELQDGLLRTRMLPFDTMVPNLRRTLRQAAQEQGKSAQLYVEGAHGEMDRNLLDRIKAPFEHMLRNAIAHGIETPAQRRKAGKPPEGSVHIRVAREATEVVIRVSDDGRGLNREAIRKRGIERGLLRSNITPTDNQLLSLITQPGFSTASQVTQLAGRGVGMDVVANEIKQLGGSLSIESEEGKGSVFVLRLPFTLAVTQAILVRIGEATFAIPMTSVQGVARVNPDDLAVRLAEDEPSFQYGNEEYGIHDLAELLGLPPGLPTEDEQQPLLLTRAGDLRAAIRIDAVLGSREIVVKSVGPQISSVPGLLGATIMGDGSVLIILDLAPLVRYGIARQQQRLADGLSAVQAPVIEEVRVRPLVMVVDDSITMRKVTGRVLERHEYEVGTAKDGVDALEKLHERVPDLMLLDIEMPRMDGYELATQMKADPRLRNVPIIMITSRSGDKHRQRAFDIGVDRYLGKPYQEADLLLQITEVLDQRAMELSDD